VSTVHWLSNMPDSLVELFLLGPAEWLYDALL
jgi:hypothetical protein